MRGRTPSSYLEHLLSYQLSLRVCARQERELPVTLDLFEVCHEHGFTDSGNHQRQLGPIFRRKWWTLSSSLLRQPSLSVHPCPFSFPYVLFHFPLSLFPSPSLCPLSCNRFFATPCPMTTLLNSALLIERLCPTPSWPQPQPQRLLKRSRTSSRPKDF